ncbi:hypothetical protein BGX38DRAFT_1183199 [Terfezia claveryi]|nr:hypothetical protein BGX38DRAFT_1183199 [Terfezia claveryi]
MHSVLLVGHLVLHLIPLQLPVSCSILDGNCPSQYLNYSFRRRSISYSDHLFLFPKVSVSLRDIPIPVPFTLPVLSY